MTAILGLLPSWAWRWLGIAAVAGSAALAFYWKGVEHETEKFDAYKAQVKMLGDKQNELTRQTIQAHKQLQEISDAEAKTATVARDAALARLRALEGSIASQRIVPAPGPSASGGDRLCFSRDELDRGLRATVARAAEQLATIAQEGQRGVDVATVCRNWARAIQVHTPAK